MIKLTRDASQPEPSEFKFEKIFSALPIVDEKSSTEWSEVLNVNELQEITLADLMLGKKRFMIAANLDGQNFYIVTTDKDWSAVKKKYPTASVVHASKLLGFAKKRIEENDFASMPSILTAMDVFPGSLVVDRTIE